MHKIGTYTYRVGLSTTTTNVDGVSEDSMPNLTIDTSGDYIYYTGNSSAYFMYYDATWTTYKITKANSYTHSNKTALYVVDDGSGDGPTPTGTTYYLATNIQAGKQYVIVSLAERVALKNDGSALAVVSVTPSNEDLPMTIEFTGDSSSILWSTTENGSGYSFSNGGKYLVRSQGAASLADSPSSSYKWNYNYSEKQVSVTGSSSTYYLSYSLNSSNVLTWRTNANTADALLYTTVP